MGGMRYTLEVRLINGAGRLYGSDTIAYLRKLKYRELNDPMVGSAIIWERMGPAGDPSVRGIDFGHFSYQAVN